MSDFIGQQLGNYRVVRLIGQGGFADVYLGEHIHLGTQAALKVLKMRLVGSSIEQFRAEARAIASLVHPNIIRVLDFGIEDGIPFLVMDYASNGMLRQRHPKGTFLPPTKIVPYVRQVAAALDYAHDAQFIHRDIKPENLLLGRKYEVLLSDFGLVVIAQTTGSQTMKEMAGTMPYMAPEQLQGKPRKASDQYSLGIVVYEWISGACPFQGTALEIATQHLHVPPPSLRAKNPMIPLAVEEVVLRALAKNPLQRFTNVWAFAAALEQAYQAAWGGSVGLPEVFTSEERAARAGSSHAPHDPNESVYWTGRATDSSTIQQDTQVDMSGNRPAVSDRTPIQAMPDSTFVFNQSLLDPSEFYGRVRERMVLLDRVRKGESTSIVGSRRIGKTWLMQYLRLVAREELGSRFLVGYLDATVQRCATIAGFSASALEVLTSQKDEFTSSDEGLLRLEQTVRQLRAQGRVSVLCIDEFEGFSTRLEFDLHFFTTMRALTQEGLCLVVASKEPLIKIVGEKGKTSGFFNVFEQRKLVPFDLKEAQQFVQSKGDQVNLTDLERQRILDYGQINGAYWPIRLQLVGKLLMEDKILALREQEPHFYRPADPAYWQDFQSRLEDIYRGAVL